MKKELQEKLFEKYPNIFKQKDLSPQETAMCWGIGCGDGWFNLLDQLCGEIQNRVENVNRQIRHKNSNRPVTIVPTKSEKLFCEATQVKEKFGSLRFYTIGGDDFIDGVVSLAESLSCVTCSECGNALKKDGPPNYRGWIYTLCPECKAKNEK